MRLMAIVILFLLACSNAKAQQGFRMPAEWEPQEAVWIGWEDLFTSTLPVTVEMIRALHGHVAIRLSTYSDSLVSVAKNYLADRDIDTNMLSFYVHDHNDNYNMRDHGATFLVNGKGKLGVADFGWSGYNAPGLIQLKYGNNADSLRKYMQLYETGAALRGKVDSLMGATTGAINFPADVVIEGGSIEVNGRGTLILCEAVTFNRNPGITRTALESAFKKALGVTHIVWVKQGPADDPWGFFRRITGNYVGGGTGGHTDEFVRFADPHTIFLSWVDEAEKDANPINRMNYDRMQENFDMLKKEVDQDGKPFTIVKIPMPSLIVREGLAVANRPRSDTGTTISRLRFPPSEMPPVGELLYRVPASSYLNFLITNGAVLLPTYVKHGTPANREADIIKHFQQYFPGREIKLIDALPLNWMGGGMHCATQPQPKTN
ncbi:agmatine deiminase family protein [Flavihumibacter petaseus]|uniref:Putative agmatine deiminase n=1 Tax=Flavihumibacter petaseus NBRC 106054 TaxID=1220578 RepID=A0A0E9N099_9BACT|nr:agmatine deiminase family protein [Flavihumibacter petaseus]GAO43051.1 putative agmatine deiminase [Flavihumibacter petaseus NBRC 106054]